MPNSCPCVESLHAVQVSAEAAAAAQKEHEASHEVLSTLSHTSSSPDHSASRNPPPSAFTLPRAGHLADHTRPSLDSAPECPVDTATPSRSPLASRKVGSGTDRASTSSPTYSSRSAGAIGLKIGVLHFTPTLEPFPLLAYPQAYKADTYDLSDPEDREFWLSLLAANVPTVLFLCSKFFKHAHDHVTLSMLVGCCTSSMLESLLLLACSQAHKAPASSPILRSASLATRRQRVNGVILSYRSLVVSASVPRAAGRSLCSGL
jgi:hypothetical protein